MYSTYLGGMKHARAELGVTSFGMQVIDLPPNVEGYPEHDHAESGQEEVYVVLSGEVDLTVDGETMRLAEGSMPMDPVSIAASSERMSPNMFPVTTTSNFLGARTSCIAALSTYM